MKMTDRIKETEREMTRLERILRLDVFNPIDVFRLHPEQLRTEKLLRSRFKSLAMMVHPDKNQQAARFVLCFQLIQVARDMLLDEQTRDICIATYGDDKETWKQIQDLRKSKQQSDEIQQQQQQQATQSRQTNSKALQVYNANDGIVSLNVRQLLRLGDIDAIRVVIHKRSSAHARNLRESSRARHENGVRQRVVQRRAAERRLARHRFTFGYVEKIAVVVRDDDSDDDDGDDDDNDR
jgi:curved DNA-binding protein CbpA